MLFLYQKTFIYQGMNCIFELSSFSNNMAIFFVPAGVGLMSHLDILASIWGRLLIIIFISLITVLTLVGIIVQKIKNKAEKSASVKEVEENA